MGYSYERASASCDGVLITLIGMNIQPIVVQDFPSTYMFICVDQRGVRW